MQEYLASSCKIHGIRHKTNVVKIDVGDLLILKNKDKRKKNWKIKVVEELYRAKDQTIRSLQIITGKR